METVKNLFKKYKEIIMYLVFGVATTVVNWIVYIICTKLFGLSGAELTNGQIALCNGIAWVVAVTFAFSITRFPFIMLIPAELCELEPEPVALLPAA